MQLKIKDFALMSFCDQLQFFTQYENIENETCFLKQLAKKKENRKR